MYKINFERSTMYMIQNDESSMYNNKNEMMGMRCINKMKADMYTNTEISDQACTRIKSCTWACSGSKNNDGSMYTIKIINATMNKRAYRGRLKAENNKNVVRTRDLMAWGE